MTPTIADLSPELARAVAEGRAAWPELRVDDRTFAEWIAARAEGAEPSRLHLGDLYLACACAGGDAAAIAAFEREHLARVDRILARTGATASIAHDAAAELRARLLVGDAARGPRIADYRGQAPLAAWVRVAAVRAAMRLRGREERHDRARDDAALPAPSPEEELIRAKYGDAFQCAFREALGVLAAEERLILRLHFAEGLNLDRLAVALGFSRATAGRRLLDARTRLREETMRILGERLSASTEDVESILAALRSYLEITMGALVSAA